MRLNLAWCRNIIQIHISLIVYMWVNSFLIANTIVFVFAHQIF